MNTKRLLTCLITVAVSVLLCSCGGDNPSDTDLDVQFTVPESVEVTEGDDVITFRILFNKAPLTSDVLVLTDSRSTAHDCSIISVESRYFTASLFSGYTSDKYEVGIRRDKAYKKMGDMSLVKKSASIVLDEGVTVYGRILCGGNPVKDVVVSDGVEAVQTDADGIYQIKSEKKYGYVFVSVPSGYETSADGILPINFKQLLSDKNTAEMVDFELYDGGDQTNHTILALGDMHLANRNNDRSQFADFVSDVNEYTSKHKGEKVYGLTLGDMTWDLYWYSKSYCFEQYLADANKITNLAVFHTIGNHDHDMKAAGDFDTVLKYISVVAPDYYSFNIGKVHYVVLDDILCTNSGAGTSESRTYDVTVSDEQIAWLKKDLAFVSSSTPIVIAMHAPVTSVTNKTALTAALSGFKTVHFITGHTHRVNNYSTSSYYDHNSGAVCATWWWTGKNTDSKVHIGQDGAPGGYQIFEVSGTEFKWQFKATGSDTDYQFRAYDRNSINLSADKCIPNASSANKTKFNTLAKDWASASSSNEVYINVWNYDSSWKVEVSENGKALSVSKVSINDPLHLLTYSAVAYNKTDDVSSVSFPTSANSHTFKTTASSATSTLTIKVTDRFGNVYTEEMSRPRELTVDNYAK